MKTPAMSPIIAAYVGSASRHKGKRRSAKCQASNMLRRPPFIAFSILWYAVYIAARLAAITIFSAAKICRAIISSHMPFTEIKLAALIIFCYRAGGAQRVCSNTASNAYHHQLIMQLLAAVKAIEDIRLFASQISRFIDDSRYKYSHAN